MARRNLAGLRVLVTGASQGIGRAIAVQAANAGCKVVASARSAEMLAELANEGRPSETERSEYEALINAADFVSVLKLKARLTLDSKIQ